MQAMVIDAFGGPERLVVREVPVPSVGRGEVLVRVDTAGVGIWDAKTRRGVWATGHDQFPLVLGAEGSGTIAALGDGVQGLRLGDAVWGYGFGSSKGGFYAEYTALAAEQVAPFPAALDYREAAAVPVTGLTALAGIDDALGLRPGQTVLIHGASGNVGIMAVQFAKYRGARVVGTCRGRDARELLRGLRADEAIDTEHDDLLAGVRRAAPDGVDAILALVGGADLERALIALRPSGKLAHPNGVDVPDGAGAIAFDGVPNPAAFARLGATFEAATIEIPIGATFGLTAADEAHRLLERGHVLGKIVLVVDATEDVVEKVA
jgi:NADPH:quinone reductase-like Zn-dependent oxidoreductase